MPQCAVIGLPGHTGHASPAALSQTVKMKSNFGAPGLGKFVPRFRAEAGHVKPKAAQQRQRVRIHLALGLASGAPGAEASGAHLVQDRFRNDRARRIAGAQKQHVVGSISHSTCSPSLSLVRDLHCGAQPQPAAPAAFALRIVCATRVRLRPVQGLRSSRTLPSERCRANSGFGQHKLHGIGGLKIARDVRRDGPHLFVAGGHQEGWRASVAFDANGKVAGFGVRQFLVAVRWHAAAGMQVGINCRAESLGRFKPRVEVEAQFARHVEIGPLAGGDHDPVERAQASRLACPSSPQR